MPDRPLEDWEYPEPDEEEFEEDVTATRECPACGAEIYEDAPECPICGAYVTFNNSPIAHWPWWFAAIGLAGVVAVIYMMSVGF